MTAKELPTTTYGKFIEAKRQNKNKNKKENQ